MKEKLNVKRAELLEDFFDQPYPKEVRKRIPTPEEVLKRIKENRERTGEQKVTGTR